VAADYGNDPINWLAAVPNPGAATRSGAAPQLLNASRSQNVSINASITLGVEATGPDLAYQWRWNGMNLPGATNSTLNLPKVQPSQMGGYRVVIYNAFGSRNRPGDRPDHDGTNLDSAATRRNHRFPRAQMFP
jgi:hypothetical protein